MTANKTTPVSPLLVATDISKHRHETFIGAPDKKRRRCLPVSWTRR